MRRYTSKTTGRPADPRPSGPGRRAFAPAGARPGAGPTKAGATVDDVKPHDGDSAEGFESLGEYWAAVEEAGVMLFEISAAGDNAAAALCRAWRGVEGLQEDWTGWPGAPKSREGWEAAYADGMDRVKQEWGRWLRVRTELENLLDRLIHAARAQGSIFTGLPGDEKALRLQHAELFLHLREEVSRQLPAGLAPDFPPINYWQREQDLNGVYEQLRTAMMVSGDASLQLPAGARPDEGGDLTPERLEQCHRAVEFIRDHQGCIHRQLAEHLGLKPTTVTKYIVPILKKHFQVTTAAGQNGGLYLASAI